MARNNVYVNIYGREELHAKFKKLEYAARGPVLERAVNAGAKVIQDDADQRAPGPHIETEIVKESTNYREIAIGPDKDHWYYQFFETGVQPFEINMATRRTSRTGDRGRPVYGAGKKALAWDDVVVARVSRGPMAARPFLRPAFDTQKDHAVGEIGHELMIEIGKVLEEK